jgi:hypothetical protein
MANIKESRLTYQVNNEWIHLTAISNVEFEKEELGSDWLFSFILKKSATEPEKQLIMSAHSEIFKATENIMCLEPAIKIRFSHDNADWGEREISGEITLLPYVESDSFSHGKYNLPRLSVNV